MLSIYNEDPNHTGTGMHSSDEEFVPIVWELLCRVSGVEHCWTLSKEAVQSFLLTLCCMLHTGTDSDGLY